MLHFLPFLFRVEWAQFSHLLKPVPWIPPQCDSGWGIFAPHSLSLYKKSASAWGSMPRELMACSSICTARTRSSFTSPAAFKQTACIKLQAQSCKACLQKSDIAPLIRGAVLSRLLQEKVMHFFFGKVNSLNLSLNPPNFYSVFIDKVQLFYGPVVWIFSPPMTCFLMYKSKV